MAAGDIPAAASFKRARHCAMTGEAMDDDLTPPAPTGADDAHRIAKGLIDAIPLAGGVLAELFEMVVVPVLHQRREAWEIRLSAVVRELRNNGVTYGQMEGDPRFTSAVMLATRVAVTTSQQAKLDALANAV